MTEKRTSLILDADEKVIQIELERLISFKNHPFKVQEDSDMEMLIDSIGKYGILVRFEKILIN